jgi:hypothetical protein
LDSCLLYAGEMDTQEGVGSLLRGSELTSFEKCANQYGLPYIAAGERLFLKYFIDVLIKLGRWPAWPVKR